MFDLCEMETTIGPVYFSVCWKMPPYEGMLKCVFRKLSDKVVHHPTDIQCKTPKVNISSYTEQTDPKLVDFPSKTGATQFLPLIKRWFDFQGNGQLLRLLLISQPFFGLKIIRPPSPNGWRKNPHEIGGGEATKDENIVDNLDHFFTG